MKFLNFISSSGVRNIIPWHAIEMIVENGPDSTVIGLLGEGHVVVPQPISRILAQLKEPDDAPFTDDDKRKP